jgi:hypothetical protein
VTSTLQCIVGGERVAADSMQDECHVYCGTSEQNILMHLHIEQVQSNLVHASLFDLCLLCVSLSLGSHRMY